jgi:hypothetical protein
MKSQQEVELQQAPSSFDPRPTSARTTLRFGAHHQTRQRLQQRLVYQQYDV